MAVAVQHMKECSLVLMQGHVNDADCSILEEVLRIASYSMNKSIWVDCEQVISVSDEALHTITPLASQARLTGVNLLFYGMSPCLKQTVKEAEEEVTLLIVPSITDASRYCSASKVAK